MSEDKSVRCTYSAAGHARHPIQYRLAFNGAPPVPTVIIGEHEHGYLVAPATDPDHVEVWCMHQEHRDTIKAALARGKRKVLSYEHGLAKVGRQYISHVSPQFWNECPNPGDMAPWMKGFFTREDVEAWARSHPDGAGDPA